MSNALETQRTYALVGTGGCGKTSLAEMLLFQAGVVTRLGAIEEGTASLDYEPEEIKRRGSIQPGFATFLWNRNRHFLVDIPGDSNFNGDLEYLLQGVDSVVLTLDAVDGVRPQTRKLWSHIRAAGLPAIVFINKMDRERANFDMALGGLTSTLGMKPVVFYMPILDKDAFVGLVDVFAGKALMFGENGEVTEAPVPEDLADEAALLRDTAVENIAESDEDLMNKYLDEGALSPEEIDLGLRKGVLAGDIVPVLVGSALANKGGRRLLNHIDKLLASPLDRPAWLGENENGDAVERPSAPDQPVAGVVFKTLSDQFSGQLSMVRVLSGELSPDATLKNMRSGETERMGSLLFVTGKTQTPCKEPLGPGAIVGVAKLKTTRTGDTLCDEKAPLPCPCPPCRRSSSPSPWPPRKREMRIRCTPPFRNCWTRTPP